MAQNFKLIETMEQRKPIFTYIITWLNPIIPPTLVFILGSCFVLTSSEPGAPKTTWMDLHFNAMITGYYFCAALSLWYYVQVRKRRFRPRWWSNLLLILCAYLAIPAFALLIGREGIKNSAPVAGEFIVLNPIFFIVATWLTRKKEEILEPKKGVDRFKSPLWILAFAPLHYVMFFTAAILCSMGFYSIRWLMHKIMTVLHQPLYNHFTSDYIIQHFPGRKAHLIFLLNSLIWGFGIWVALRLFRQKRKPEQDTDYRCGK